MVQPQDLIRKAYAAFNARNIPAVLTTFHPQVRWSKAWEGGYVAGHEEVSDYWTRQWREVDAHVEPTAIHERADGRFGVTVHQVVRDKQGQVLFDGLVLHVYTVQDGLLKQMDIEQGSTLAPTNTEA